MNLAQQIRAVCTGVIILSLVTIALNVVRFLT
jgi:hypothetical protein